MSPAPAPQAHLGGGSVCIHTLARLAPVRHSRSPSSWMAMHPSVDSYCQGRSPVRRQRLVLILVSLSPVCLVGLPSGHAQTAADVYSRIEEQSSKIHWCVPEAGNDPSNIIASRCKVYSACLADSGLDGKVDTPPFPDLSPAQREKVKVCHQGLYNAARMNPQIRGSGATQVWLQNGVIQGTEAKPFSIPNSTGPPH
jgi:hypothetical protein